MSNLYLQYQRDLTCRIDAKSSPKPVPVGSGLMYHAILSLFATMPLRTEALSRKRHHVGRTILDWPPKKTWLNSIFLGLFA
jgi:hypothetical protein